MAKKLDDDCLVTCDMGVWFRLEKINSNQSFRRKLTALFQGIFFHDCRVIRRAGRTYYRIIIDKTNLVNLLESRNLGHFEEDYSLTVEGFHVNNEADCEPQIVTPETPIKEVSQVKEIGENILKIDLRKSEDKNGPLARGVQTYNLMSDFTEIENVLEHFGVDLERVNALVKPTPAIPTLLVELKTKLSDWIANTDARRDPYLVYKPAPQSERMGRTQIWAHAVLEDNQTERRVIVEGVYQRVSVEELLHTLRYNGEVLSAPTPLKWKDSEIANGDMMVMMKLKREMNVIILKGEPFKVSYAKQERQCSHCWSFSHKNNECGHWDTDARTLLLDFYKRWQREVRFEEYDPTKDAQSQVNESNLPKSQEDQLSSNFSQNFTGDMDDILPVKLLSEFGHKYTTNASRSWSKDHSKADKEIEAVNAPREEGEKAQSSGILKSNEKRTSAERVKKKLTFDEVNNSGDGKEDKESKTANTGRAEGTADKKNFVAGEETDKRELEDEIAVSLEKNSRKEEIQQKEDGEETDKRELEDEFAVALEKNSRKEEIQQKEDEGNSELQDKNRQATSSQEVKEEIKEEGKQPQRKKEGKEKKIIQTEAKGDSGKVEEDAAKATTTSSAEENDPLDRKHEVLTDELIPTKEEAKKRKHEEKSKTNLTPEKKKVVVEAKRDIVKEIRKIEKDSANKEISDVKKRVLKTRLDSLMNNDNFANEEAELIHLAAERIRKNLCVSK